MNTNKDPRHVSGSVPDPLQPGEIEGQNPNTPERLPGHTRHHQTNARPASDWIMSNVLMVAVALGALLALVAMLAASA